MIELASYLRGSWVSGQGAGSRLFDPVTGEAIAVARSEGLDLAGALAYLRDVGGPALRALDFEARGNLLASISKAIHAIRDELLDLSIRNTGVTRGDAKFDVDGGTATLSAYANLAKSLGKRRYFVDAPGIPLGRSPRFHGVHIKSPLRGAAVHINAFNFPIWGFAEKLACAFLAGMPVLSKPATSTALPTFRAMQAVVQNAGLPDGVLALLSGGVGSLLDHLRSQDVIAFTGSAATGRRIRGHASVIAHGVRVNIEADSLNSAVLGPDVEVGSDTWALFLREVAREVTQKSGQKCTATRRVFVPAERIEEVVEGLKDRLAEFPPGRPEDPGVRMGALATPSQFPDVLQGLKTLAESCRVAIGQVPEAVPAHGVFAPVVFVCQDPRAVRVVHDLEVFGPATTLCAYDGRASEAAALVAMGDGSLVASIYSDDLGFVGDLTLEIAPWHGRVLLGSAKIAEYSTGPGLVLPELAHGGPGRAGGGLELGGVRGLDLYLQTTAIQGSRPVLERILDFQAGN